MLGGLAKTYLERLQGVRWREPHSSMSAHLLTEPVIAAFVGMLAALMIPGILLVIPGQHLARAAEDPFTMLSLWSVCFIAALVGLPVIEFILAEVRYRMEERRLAREKGRPSLEPDTGPSGSEPG
jgi:hypothetical protein